MTQLDLSGLKEIHIPVRPDIWPLPIGWHILIWSGFICILIGLYVMYRWYTSPRRYALKELHKIALSENTAQEKAKEISKLLKRIAVFQFGSEATASLSQERWSSFLETAAPRIFSPEEANFIAFSTYLPDNKVTFKHQDNLIQKTKNWIQVVFKKRNKDR